MLTPEDCEYLQQILLEIMEDDYKNGNTSYYNKHSDLLTKLSQLQEQLERSRA